MADPNFSWIYLLIFMAIPLVRIIPRFLARRKMQNNPSQDIQERQFEPGFSEYGRPQMKSKKPEMKSSKPQTKDMIVLGELNRGAKTFEKIQKNTGLDVKELDSILGDLEEKGLLKVIQKQGLFGPKTELYPTDKGFSKYYS